ncbi:unnamed protein product [Callosobruchus maculatus]|uniref:Uncharacterized protein n=1 Tax=Callosobruchus maculatus TaxID=64391 RepID=A0A653BIT1_CALMS|nr:unnamed protein product [Callosobruchus maculatus]
MPKRFRNLLDDAVPTLFLPKSMIESFNSSSSMCSKRSQRMQAKKEIEDRKAVIDNILADSSHETMGAIQQGCESQVVEIEITPDFIPDRINSDEYFVLVLLDDGTTPFIKAL